MRLAMHGRKLTNPKFQILATPDTSSSILEVCDQEDVDFLHVSQTKAGEYEFKFFLDKEYIVLSLSQLQEITEAAKRNIVYVDLLDEE